jgi:hypothetical protein
MADLKKIQKKILSFRNERNWAQFHDPKNLAEALSIEAGELLENFLWGSTDQFRANSSLKAQNFAAHVAESTCP